MCCGGGTPKAQATMRERAVRCLTCPHPVRRDPRRLARLIRVGRVRQRAAYPVACDGNPIELYVNGKRKCPRGRHAPSGLWIGVPFPRRVLAFIMGARLSHLAMLPECGCFRPAKEAWELVKTWRLTRPNRRFA